MEDWQSGRMQEFAKFQVGEIRPIGSNPISSATEFASAVKTDLLWKSWSRGHDRPFPPRGTSEPIKNPSVMTKSQGENVSLSRMKKTVRQINVTVPEWSKGTVCKTVKPSVQIRPVTPDFESC